MVTQTRNNLSALPSKSIIFQYNFPKLLDFFFPLTALVYSNRINLTSTFTKEFMPDPQTPGTLTISNLFIIY